MDNSKQPLQLSHAAEDPQRGGLLFGNHARNDFQLEGGLVSTRRCSRLGRDSAYSMWAGSIRGQRPRRRLRCSAPRQSSNLIHLGRRLPFWCVRMFKGFGGGVHVLRVEGVVYGARPQMQDSRSRCSCLVSRLGVPRKVKCQGYEAEDREIDAGKA